MTQGKECPRKRTFHRNSHVTATGIKHVDIKFSAHGAFLVKPSSAALKIENMESEIILIAFGAITPKGLHD